MSETKTIEVCSACFRASCWLGLFYCDEYQSAGTVVKTIEELRKLGLEDESYWATENFV